MLELLDFAVAIPALELWTADGPEPIVRDREPRAWCPSVVERFVQDPAG
jgi:hypothetical protein